MHIDESQLESFLLDSGLISPKGLEEVKKTTVEKKISLDGALVSRGILTADDLRRAQAYILGIPFIDLKDQKLDFAVLSLIPEPIARGHNIVAFRKTDGLVEVAMLEIKDFQAVDFLQKKFGLKARPHLTDTESLKGALVSYQRLLKAEFGDLIQRVASDLKGDSAKDDQVMRLVETLLKHAIIQNAFEIHLEPQENELLVRYRLNGSLYEAMVLPQKLTPLVVNCLKALAHLDTEDSLPQEGRFKIKSDAGSLAFRLSTLPTNYGGKMLVRILTERGSGFTLESLGFADAQVEEIYRVLRSGSGVILVSGEEGSGKTTALYTLLDILNTPSLSLATVENAIEYAMPLVNQVSVRPEIGLSFPNALRAVLKQKPDVVMVGELRDSETLGLVLTAVESGVLILSALGASSAQEALIRLKSMTTHPERLANPNHLLVQLAPKEKRGVEEMLAITPEFLGKA